MTPDSTPSKRAGDELLPCPFCGGPASCYEHSSERDGMPDGTWFVRCDPCDLIIDTAWCVPLREAVAAWNTRAALSAIPLDRALSEDEREVVEAINWTADPANGVGGMTLEKHEAVTLSTLLADLAPVLREREGRGE